MSTRQTRNIFISTSSGVFSSIEDAISAANSIKIWLQRLCARKGYACQGTIGISANNPKDGRVGRTKTGKKGRPINAFIYKNSTIAHKSVQPHIHIILKANPAHTIGKAIVAYFKRFGPKSAQYKDCSDYADTAAEYLQKQSLKVRNISCNVELFSFTAMICSSEPESAENACNNDAAKSSPELQCNNDNDLEISENLKDTIPREQGIVLLGSISVLRQMWCTSGFR